MKQKCAIYSCEGFAREILPSIRRQFGGDPDIVFVDDDPAKRQEAVHGCAVIGFEELCGPIHRDRLVSVAVADTKVREMLVKRCLQSGLSFMTVCDVSHIQFDNVSIGEGAILCANTMITGDAVIGSHFHCNIYSYVAHDCRIGDFVTFAPRVCCNGRVEIDDHAYVGTGATLKQGTHSEPLRIGKGAVVGMGAVVLNDVGDGEVVVGNPARVIRKI
jgi:sugar O-acyltransferase (sialic acid O-acetyltransferase NeuD family)